MNGQLPIKMNSPVNIVSLSGLLTILVGLGIIFIGVREFFYPGVAARGFGVPLLDSADSNLLAIKAGRDIASGILALTFLGLHDRTFLALITAIFFPHFFCHFTYSGCVYIGAEDMQLGLSHHSF